MKKLISRLAGALLILLLLITGALTWLSFGRARGTIAIYQYKDGRIGAPTTHLQTMNLATDVLDPEDLTAGPAPLEKAVLLGVYQMKVSYRPRRLPGIGKPVLFLFTRDIAWFRVDGAESYGTYDHTDQTIVDVCNDCTIEEYCTIIAGKEIRHYHKTR